ncbi:N-acetylneuraminate synthase family protein [Candidatus Pelagibacter bacterium nBUS_28]|jgi:sialic acid synthase SpsE|uniref:N-acetylneuraminate synthase family protein n=1 Tax=Candidatus Pelagibacter bacterium nBUS_28 TaxID=3374189 RepID=UPI003EB79E70
MINLNTYNKKIDIGNKFITNKGVFIIAEIGSNHNQDLDIAFQSIDAAVVAGADAVKFQNINLEKLYHKKDKDLIQLHKQIDLNIDWLFKLKEHCDKKNIIFFSSPTYLEAVDLLVEVGVELFKIASPQANFPQLIKKVSKTGKPAIISSGQSTLEALKNSVCNFLSQGNDKLIILHCNSIYPTPFEKVNLKMIEELKKIFKGHIGFSDHTLGVSAPISAVALGANVIEKHFVLNKNFNSPDAKFSLDPNEFKYMVKCIRETESILISNDRSYLHPVEEKYRKSFIYRAVLKRNIREGDLLVEKDLNFLRAGTGIDANDLDSYINSGARFKKSMKIGDLINSCDLKLD